MRPWLSRVRVCQDTSWLTNDGEIAAAFSADVWKVPEREVVKLGNFASKVANAFLLCPSVAHCSCVACLEGNLSQPTTSSLETGPVLEEPNLAEHPPRSGELKEVWGRSTGLPLDSQRKSSSLVVRKWTSWHSSASPSRHLFKSAMIRQVTIQCVDNGSTSTRVTKVIHRFGHDWWQWRHRTDRALTRMTGMPTSPRLRHSKRIDFKCPWTCLATSPS